MVNLYSDNHHLEFSELRGDSFGEREARKTARSSKKVHCFSKTAASVEFEGRNNKVTYRREEVRGSKVPFE
jgi:hypothetical protein